MQSNLISNFINN